MNRLMLAVRQAIKTLRTPSSIVARNSFDAGGSGPRLRGWITPPAGPNRALDNLSTLRNRARDAARNEWSAKAARNKWAANLVGTGILARPKTADRALRERLISLWDAWTEQCDAGAALDLYGLQSLVARAWIESGEVFVRLRARRVEDGLPAPLQLQILEADMLPMLDADSYPGMPPGNYIRAGIEHNRIGKRVAYWFHAAHPGDNPPPNISTSELRRTPAAEVLHIYEPDRPGQLRGISEFATILPKLRGVGNFDDAVLHRQEIANLFAMFVVRTDTSEGPFPASGSGRSTDAPLAPLMPGTSQELAYGEDVRFSDPPDAGTAYGDYMRNQHMHIAAGLDMPYELLTGDVRDVSDRTLRVVLMEFRRRCQQRQWNVLIPQLMRPIRSAWADACLIAGHLTPDEAAEAKRVTWSPQAWPYFHPVQDVQADQIAVQSGFTSRTRVIAERGDDPEEIDRERHDDATRAEELGLSQPAPEADRGLPSIEHDPKPASQEVEAATAAIAAAAPRPPIATPESVVPVVHLHAPITIQMPAAPDPQPAQVQVDVHVPAPPEAPAPVVNVAPQIHLAAPDIPPAQVVITHPERAIQTVERDAQGEIVRTETVYTPPGDAL